MYEQAASALIQINLRSRPQVITIIPEAPVR